MRRVRIGFGVMSLVILSLCTFLLWGEVSASPKQLDKRAASGCAGVVSQRGEASAQRTVVYEAQAQHLLQQGWEFNSYCCNPEFTDRNGQCSVYLVRR